MWPATANEVGIANILKVVKDGKLLRTFSLNSFTGPEIMGYGCHLVISPGFRDDLGPYTLNKKSLNGQGKSMITVLQKKFLVQ